MGEVVNVLVAFAMIIFLLRWVLSGKDSTEQRSAADVLGFRPKAVTPDMVTAVSSMFPDIPPDNIRYDLMRTGSVELTTNKILEKGYLDPPSQAYYNLYPRQHANTPQTGTQATTGTSSATKKLPVESLISRYQLEERVQTGVSIPETELKDVGGKATWEDNPERREASLRERKAKMVLAARQRLLAEKQKNAGDKTSAINVGDEKL